MPGPYTHHHPTEQEITEARERGPRGLWLIVESPADEQYPCRCPERRFSKCSAVFCPCAGRPDPVDHLCCGWRNTPEVVAIAAAAWQAERERRRAAGETEEAAT